MNESGLRLEMFMTLKQTRQQISLKTHLRKSNLIVQAAATDSNESVSRESDSDSVGPFSVTRLPTFCRIQQGIHSTVFAFSV